MDLYEGYSVTTGSALAAVAKVRFDFGIAAFTSQRLKTLGERLQKQEEEGALETEQVIVVAKSLPLSLLSGTMPGLEIVGVAVADYIDEPEFTAVANVKDMVPIVAGLGDGLLQSVEEYELLLLDGDNGRVFASPDAYLVSRFQTSSRRKRYHMEGVHVPARTASDNRVVTVVAALWRWNDLDSAIRNGADALYLPPGNSLLSPDHEGLASADDQRRAINNIVDESGGLPLIVDMPTSDLAITVILEAAAVAPCLIATEGGEAWEAVSHSLETAKMFAPPEAEYGDAPAVLTIVAQDGAGIPDDLAPFAGVLLRDPWPAYPTENLFAILSQAGAQSMPVYAMLPAASNHNGSSSGAWNDEIEDMIRFGVKGIIVPPDAAADIKDAIREI